MEIGGLQHSLSTYDDVGLANSDPCKSGVCVP
jgi:hypothetical protein